MSPDGTLSSTCIAADYVYSVSSILHNNEQLRSLALHNHAFNEMGIVVLAKALEVGAGEEGGAGLLQRQGPL